MKIIQYPSKIIGNNHVEYVPVAQMSAKTGDYVVGAFPLRVGYLPVYRNENSVKSGQYIIHMCPEINRHVIIFPI